MARDSKQNPMVQRNSSFATSHEVWKYICELGISKVRLLLATFCSGFDRNFVTFLQITAKVVKTRVESSTGW